LIWLDACQVLRRVDLEARDQLAERARRWGVRYHELAIPDAPWWSHRVIWVVHGDRRRMNTIGHVWSQHAQCPLLIASVKDLTIDGVMHPLARAVERRGRSALHSPAMPWRK
jgi:hypothetical protein